jgi:hypothetical protein
MYSSIRAKRTFASNLPVEVSAELRKKSGGSQERSVSVWARIIERHISPSLIY